MRRGSGLDGRAASTETCDVTVSSLCSAGVEYQPGVPAARVRRGTILRGLAVAATLRDDQAAEGF